MSTRESVTHLVELVLTGKLMEAYDTYYGDNVSMQENRHPATVGKAENRLRELAFLDSIAEFHSASVPVTIVEGDHAVIHWLMDFTNKEGVRVQYDQLAYQKWENGKVVEERFFYDSANY